MSALLEDVLEPQFRFFSLSINQWTFAYGVLLSVWSLVTSVLSGFESMTSMIPAALGLPVIAMGAAAVRWPKKNKIWMHVAMVFALIAFLGGADFFRPLTVGTPLFVNPVASISKLLMLISSAFFLFICIRSFRWARIQQ
jgi:hypothetical protein